MGNQLHVPAVEAHEHSTPATRRSSTRRTPTYNFGINPYANRHRRQAAGLRGRHVDELLSRQHPARAAGRDRTSDGRLRAPVFLPACPCAGRGAGMRDATPISSEFGDLHARRCADPGRESLLPGGTARSAKSANMSAKLVIVVACLFAAPLALAQTPERDAVRPPESGHGSRQRQADRRKLSRQLPEPEPVPRQLELVDVRHARRRAARRRHEAIFQIESQFSATPAAGARRTADATSACADRGERSGWASSSRRTTTSTRSSATRRR